MASHPIGQRIIDQADTGPLSELQEYEDLYLKETAKANQSPRAKFDYAWALVRSKRKLEVKKGIIILQGLLEDGYDERDCLYYMAVGRLRQGDYKVAKLCLEKLVEFDPSCRQALSLMDLVDDSMVKEGSIGITTVAGVAMIITILTLALTVYSRSRAAA